MNNKEQLAIEIAKALDHGKAEAIRILDVRGISTVTDYCVVATGNSGPHLNGLLREVHAHMKELGEAHYRKSGDPESGWILIDYFSVVAHVFAPEAREYYDIEKLWIGAKEIPLVLD